MLTDVGMMVLKSRETSAVLLYAARQGIRAVYYMQNEGSIYAAKQGMRAVYMQQDRG